MRRTIGIRELRDTLTATIRRVRAGERFEITHDGAPVALLSPLPRDRIAGLIADGDVAPPRRPPEWALPRRRPKGKTATEALAEDRDER